LLPPIASSACVRRKLSGASISSNPSGTAASVDGTRMKLPLPLFVLCAVSSVVHAQGVHFTNILRLTNHEVSLRFNAPVGTNYRVDVATNFPADTNLQRWQGLLTFRSTGANQHVDSATPYLGTRFYRAEQLPTTNDLTGDHLSTTNGDAIIHPVGHATFVISWNGRTIYNDPTNGGAAYVNFPRGDLILVSHEHGDHYNSNTLFAVRGQGGVIIAPPAVYNLNSFAPFRPNAIALAYGQSTNVNGIHVEAVPAYNGNHAYGINNAYIMTLGGRRIFTTGDSGDVPEIRAVTNIDVAFICMNLPFTTNALGATNIVRAMRPKIVYPYHYRNSNGSMTNAPTFKQWLGSDLGIEVRLRSWY
jgi:L-ascorbate metabolism protein UlaG (beta-lactamase superfamily)